MKVQRQFFRDINKWVKDGCPDDHPIFSSMSGLCHNYAYWCIIKGKRDRSMESFLKLNGFHNHFPFNDDNPLAYLSECNKRAIYNNPARLEFIQNHSR